MFIIITIIFVVVHRGGVEGLVAPTSTAPRRSKMPNSASLGDALTRRQPGVDLMLFVIYRDISFQVIEHKLS
jgi:hypothetical protein